MIPFLMAYSISDNTIFSTARKIVLYHREMVSPCTAFASLSLFSLRRLSLYLTCHCRRLHQTYIHVNEFQT